MSINSKDFSSLKGKKILVTGGCGFIGSHICERLVKIGAQVVILDNLSSGKIRNIALFSHKVKFIQKDLCDQGVISDALKGIDLVCHQAALRGIPKSMKMPLEYHTTNVTGSLQLFLKAKELGIKKIVCASSSSVYGLRTDFPETESDALSPISPYAATKQAVENYSQMLNQSFGMQIVNLRYFNVFGPRQAGDDEYSAVIPKFIKNFLNNQPVTIYGNGQQERNFTYVDNIVEANLAALVLEGGGIFNVAHGLPHSVNSLYETLKKLIPESSSIAQYLAPRPGDVEKTFADISLLKTVLGVTPQIDFTEGLKRTVEWFKAQSA